MLDMAIKVKQNLAMLPSKQPKFKEWRRPKYTYRSYPESKLKSKEVSEKELAEVISQIRCDAKKDRKKRVLVLFLSIFALIVISHSLK